MHFEGAVPTFDLIKLWSEVYTVPKWQTVLSLVRTVNPIPRISKHLNTILLQIKTLFTGMKNTVQQLRILYISY